MTQGLSANARYGTKVQFQRWLETIMTEDDETGSYDAVAQLKFEMA
jgi:hypothetical protein